MIKDYVGGLLEAEEDFLEHLDTLDVVEQNVSELSRKMAADFIGLVLTDAGRLVRESGMRKRGDPVLTTAMLDGILHHARCFSFRGESYWLKHPDQYGQTE